MTRGALLLLLALGTRPFVADASVCGTTPPSILPKPRSVELVPYPLACDSEDDVVLDNDQFTDTNGPRDAPNATACCSLCAATDGCNFWSFNIDKTNFPDQGPGSCRWHELSYCCFLHTTNANKTNTTAASTTSIHQFNASGAWTSGALTSPSTDTDSTTAAPSSDADGMSRSVFSLAPNTPLLYSSDELAPLAAVFSDELFAKSGFRLVPAAGDAASSSLPSVSLSLSSRRRHTTLRGNVGVVDANENYTISVTADGVEVACDDPVGCAWGTQTLVQFVCVGGVGVLEVAVQALQVVDGPDKPYRAMMLDLARTQVSVWDIQSCVSFCRFYKIRFLHLHFGDDHAWTFPSDAFPALGSKNLGFDGPAPVVYSKQDLVDLVAFADARGVILIPELEGPSHSAAMRRSVPSFQGAGGDEPGMGGCINAASQQVYDDMTTLLGEYAAIFTTSPYIHIGCDESGVPDTLPGYKEFAALHDIKSAGDLFAYYVKYMADQVAALGKKAIVWEGAAIGRLQPGDAVVQIWLGDSGGAAAATARGLEVVNCPAADHNQEREYERAITDFSHKVGYESELLLWHRLRATQPSPSPSPDGLGGWGGARTRPSSPRALIPADDDTPASLRVADDGGAYGGVNTSLVIGVQNHLWEGGYRYCIIQYGSDAVARSAGPGWRCDAARNWTMDGSHAYGGQERQRNRLWPLDSLPHLPDV